MTKKERFLQTYANLPIASRNEIIVVVDGEPMTWKAAKIEVEVNTPTGMKILDKLESMDLLK
ncbi:hypothetical protein CO083_06085 [Candidatus Roizmanbacteria bacterium CG_4_9_14_0_8_um_filter_34_12]|uniref:Uncharacterized protein n=6 Tax=Candidatus Roizmaniibacteriota TaxID=1752723 RepID=A0A2M7BY34_9BACT|nr:hypothetical protein [Candidatus Roizmanbacteria bacterium]PIP64229.1 MAG: hypothetical protein COW96_03705 [Candidatus Roizmanbacteria bacterium CG22_combo_CG10-13_8_21_14_all_33_16]PIQ72249.1 MAG: hypothetical protein COV86_04005 [Candidatus Roizmanbacteria bacterium CG11_big_fil_rev_8_21_14_0_20_35_14]PIV11440.1 MAG: hypothetical protein COS50_00150 [Candidatus Roizmanbacteria bacterium CG03_land_8_20_14_0_80_35_26]PIX73786.1 MAG: hypothetical protein COZ39_01820 [Candidatus Roizmanbacter